MLLLVVAACQTGLTPEELQNPESCAECHPNHVEQWSGSMHAYAGEDPLFRAFNAMGQAETNGELGDFCVKCHAPMAVELGLTTDGLDLDDMPDHLQGVTCATCHQVEAVAGTHNNPLVIALDGVMRGGIANPTRTPAHPSAWSALHDREEAGSSEMCGTCHDIVTPLGAHIERTYAEWQEGLFADPVVGLQCGGCHMQGSNGIAAHVEGAPLRRIHDHSFPGVDVALTEFPRRPEQRALVEAFLNDAIVANLCVQPSDGPTTPVIVALDNVASGHSFPSGATADRRVWVQIEAFAGEERLWASGTVAEGQPFEAFTEQATEPVWALHSTLLDGTGAPTHRFWEAADIDESGLLRVHTTLDPSDPDYIRTVQFRNFLVEGTGIDRIRMAVKVRPFPLDFVDELIDGGWLDPAVRSELPTFTLSPTVLEWTPEVPVNSGNLACVPEPPPT